jgi:Ca-activated chloride channel family protein
MIDREEKTEAAVKEFFHFRELYLFFLIPALLLLCLEVFLNATISRTIP